MQNFEALCRTLNESFSLRNAPNPNIQAITLFQDPSDLQRKAHHHFTTHKTHLASEDVNLQLKHIGCCPIDRFNGCDLLKMLCDILKGDLRHGDCLYFSVDGKLITAVIIVKFNVLSVTINIWNQDRRFQRMFVKLFDDPKIKKQREEYGDPNGFYQEKLISALRQKAKSEYHNFLTQKFSQFMKDQAWNSFKFELWNSFFGVLVAVANRISRAGIFSSTRSRFPSIAHIPYAACIKFAFDKDESGKVSELLGEIGCLNTADSNKIDYSKAEKIVPTAKFLISKVISPLNDGTEEMWSTVEVEKLAEDVKKFYGKQI